MLLVKKSKEPSVKVRLREAHEIRAKLEEIRTEIQRVQAENEQTIAQNEELIQTLLAELKPPSKRQVKRS